MALITLSSCSLLPFLILKELDIEPLGAFVNRDGLASVDLLTMGMLEKALLPRSSWPLSEVAGNKRNKCSKLRSAAIGLLSLARRVSRESSLVD
jgi:hypothetical protein